MLRLRALATTTAGLAFAVTAAAACASRPPADVMSGTDASMSGNMMTMTGQLMSMSGSSVTGTTSVMHGSAMNEFRSTISISGAPANGMHPWHVHAGQCGSNGPIVGAASAYPVLQADANGVATANAAVAAMLPSGPLYVNVHMSPSMMSTIVACANLTMQGM